MPLAHILAPQIARKSAEIEAQLGQNAGYLRQPIATATRQPVAAGGPIVMIAPGDVLSEAQIAQQGVADRARAGAVDEGKTRTAETLRDAFGIDRSKHAGPGSQQPLDRRKRIDALANKENWTAQDLATISDADLNVARAARRRLNTPADPDLEPMPGPTIDPQGFYGIYKDPVTKDRSIEMFTPELPYGTAAGGYLGMNMNNLRAPMRQGPVEVGQTTSPRYLQAADADAARRMSADQYIGYLAEQMRIRNGLPPTI